MCTCVCPRAFCCVGQAAERRELPERGIALDLVSRNSQEAKDWKGNLWVPSLVHPSPTPMRALLGAMLLCALLCIRVVPVLWPPPPFLSLLLHSCPVAGCLRELPRPPPQMAALPLQRIG